MSWPEDPDSLVGQLNSLAPDRRPEAAANTSRLERWLEIMVRRQAADLLLVAGCPPSLRLDGEIERLDRKAGSFTLEECLVALVRTGLVERSEAALLAGHAEEFESALAAAGL